MRNVYGPDDSVQSLFQKRCNAFQMQKTAKNIDRTLWLPGEKEGIKDVHMRHKENNIFLLNILIIMQILF